MLNHGNHKLLLNLSKFLLLYFSCTFTVTVAVDDVSTVFIIINRQQPCIDDGFALRSGKFDLVRHI